MIHLPEHVVSFIRTLGVLSLVMMWAGVALVALYRRLTAQNTEPGPYGTSWHRDVLDGDLEPLPVNSDPASDE